VNRLERELRENRDSHARRDEALRGLAVVDLEQDVGLEAGDRASAAHDAVVRARLQDAAIDARPTEALGRKRRERDAATAREAVTGGQDDGVRVVAEGGARDIRAEGVVDRVLVHDRDVEIARAQQRQRLVRRRLDQPQAHVGMLRVELGDRRDDDPRASRGKRREAQLAAAQARNRVELVAGRGEAPEDHFCVRCQRRARRRQLERPHRALDERRAGLALERGDLLGHGGLRVLERVGRARERAPRRDLAEDP
jgi:hypothetical protein